MKEYFFPPPALKSAGLALRAWLRALKIRHGNGISAGGTRSALSDLIEGTRAAPAASEISEAERRLLVNVLGMRQHDLADVMVPRAGIVAVEIGASLAEVIAAMTREGHSRLPVYRETLDDTLGMVHIKDVLFWRGRDSEFALDKIMRKILFVAPSMHVLELLLEMRVKRVHMALVVDEFGGADGLVTIEDLVEEIVGEIEDEHDRVEQPMLVRLADGAFETDGRVPIEEFESQSGIVFTPDERAEIDTLGGLVVAAAGEVPIRGQLVRHSSGLEFEVLDADPRRVKRIRVRRRGREPAPIIGAAPSGGGREPAPIIGAAPSGGGREPAPDKGAAVMAPGSPAAKA
ncbi:MAG: HlyC/CorC family transporter [Rhodospirillales bacterium]|nr:HlyC/CorC family transporter [Rhodospirillales bacterium]MSP80700.1 HlyC/CorC family transporter [Rhodospirillales bacterium]